MIHSNRVIMKLIMFIFLTYSFVFSQNSDKKPYTLSDTYKIGIENQKNKKPTHLEQRLGPAPESRGLSSQYESPDLSELDKYKDCVPENILHSQEYSISNFEVICSENTEKKQDKIMLYSIIGLIVLIIILVLFSKNKKDWEHIEKNNTDI